MADPVGQPQDVDQLVTSLSGALRELAPTDEVVIHDFEGAEFRLRAVLPARRQVQVFRALAELLGAAGKSLASGEVTGGGILQVLVQLITDEAVIEQLGRAFRVAYPKVLAGQDPLDAFPIEEIVASLLPLLVRLVRRSGSFIADVAT